MMRSTPRFITKATRQRGAAIAEFVVALLVFVPFMIGIPLLGKQIDIKHKSYDATRYSVWERTAWRSGGPSNTKSNADIELEARDRALGSARTGIVDPATIRAQGVTENMLWQDRAGRRLLDYDNGPFDDNQRMDDSPVDVGRVVAPALAYGRNLGAVAGALRAIGFEDLGVDNNTLASADLAVAIKPLLQERARRETKLGRSEPRGDEPDPLIQQASGAILSDSWAARDEGQFRNRVGNLMLEERLRDIEMPGLFFGYIALGKGRAFFGEAQFGSDSDLDARTTTLPQDYVGD